MIDDLTSLIEGIASQLGLTLLLSGFMPMLVGVAVNQYIIFAPVYAGTAALWNFFPGAGNWLGAYTGEILTTLVLAFGLGLAIMPLNLFVIRLFEGTLPGMKALLFPFYRSKRIRYERKQYAAIAGERARRRALLAAYEDTGEFDQEADFAVQERLHELHAGREQIEPLQTLPFERHRLTPTGFGNVWAIMEEYPGNRYGIDGLLFWPYLRTILLRENPQLLGQIDNQKLLLDIVLHLALVAGILTLEGISFAIARMQVAMAVLATISLVLFWLLYRASVNYVRTMGMFVAQGYDLYRWKLLEAFGLACPDNLDDEFWVWTRLSAFLRRGEPFYFDMLERRGGTADETGED